MLSRSASRFVALLSAVVLAAHSLAFAQDAVLYPHDIQGAGFLSPLDGKDVTNVQGVVTAIGPAGYYIQTPSKQEDDDVRTSEGVYVFGPVPDTIRKNDLVQIGQARVSEYRSSSAHLRLTQLTKATNVTVIRNQQGSRVKTTVIGRHRTPPTEFIGVEDFFAVPAGTVNVETARSSALQPDRFGLDFWESLEGMLVTIKKGTALGKPSSFGEFWALPGNIDVTSRNSRGGVTVAARSEGESPRWDVNPEAINVGKPLDGTENPKEVKLGDEVKSFDGIVSYAFGVPVIYPFTAVEVSKAKRGTITPTSYSTDGSCSSFLVSGYNVENLAAGDPRIPAIGRQVDELLATPDVIGFIEVQDDDGSANSGIVSANRTLADLAAVITGASYQPATIDPVNNQDGGEPGGNIRPAFLFRPDHVRLSGDVPAGAAGQGVAVAAGSDGRATLSLNPGLIDPTNAAWANSRKPLVAQFDLVNGGQRVFVIAVHFTSKGGSGQAWGPQQAPINGGVGKRVEQARIVREFVARIQSVQPDAKVIILGDFNEFSGVQPLEALVAPATGSTLSAVKEVQVPERVERYSYIFQQNCQQIDHIFVSSALEGRAEIEIIHANTWVTDADAISDHDPVAGQFNLC